MTVLDAFNSSAFKMLEMTSAINRMPHVPTRIGTMGLFTSKGVRTRQVEIEERGGTLALIPNTPRSGPNNQNAHGKRRVRSFTTTHLPLEDTIMAEELQDVRAFGGTELQGLEEVRDQRLGDMKAKHDATIEWQRIGAIKGNVLDADGATVIYNFFTEFGVTQDTVDFLLGTDLTDVKAKVASVLRLIETELGMQTYTSVRAICGDTFWDKLVNHPKVATAYDKANDRSYFVEDMRFQGFYFAGVWWENYRGKVGATSFVAASECHFVPVGVPDLFQTVFSPGNFLETVNTNGLPFYAKSKIMDYERGLNILTESNPLSFCTRPKVLVKGTTSN